MRLYEFAGPNPMVTKLVAVGDQLKSDLEKGQADPNMSVPDFLQYLKKYDIIYDKTDLYDMIKQLPLKNLISNIQGDKIVFKGFGTPEAPPEEESKKVVAGMAKHATGK
jgi:hypothetical protein